jgi:hypothetical protein
MTCPSGYAIMTTQIPGVDAAAATLEGLVSRMIDERTAHPRATPARRARPDHRRGQGVTLHPRGAVPMIVTRRSSSV